MNSRLTETHIEEVINLINEFTEQLAHLVYFDLPNKFWVIKVESPKANFQVNYEYSTNLWSSDNAVFNQLLDSVNNFCEVE